MALRDPLSRDPASSLWETYRPPAGVADELLRADGSVRDVWQPFISYLATQSPDALSARFARGDQYLRDEGVYFRQYTGSGSTERAWPLSHIPVMIASSDWAELASGLAQRADLLEKVMADLYGPGDLVTDGYLPAELVAQNPEWLRPMVGAVPRSGHHLHFLAFEVGRSPDGNWIVLGDRTQAPSGAGFALENRMATSRVFHEFYPAANAVRLAGFFRSFRDALYGLCDGDRGQVAILTPGQHTDTFFEHAYIARYLGFLLLEGDDLRVENDRLVVRTIDGPEPVSVVWRRLDSRFADPLEMDDTSALGTPGMTSALRSGAATMVNGLGSGVLEARALMAFLPSISRRLTGERLTLPNIATWWCGQKAERTYVGENLDRMIIGPAFSTRLPFDADGSTAIGGRFRGHAQRSLRSWLEREGHGLVGQEAVTLSTTPAMIGGELAPRPMILRVFAARTPDGWKVMPGGYARVGRSEDPAALAMQHGGSVADVWVIGDTPDRTVTLTDAEPGGRPLRRMPGQLPSRAADNLYWLGRYVERADFAVRTLRAHHLRLADSGDTADPLVEHLAKFLARYGHDAASPIPVSLVETFDLARGCAGRIRDRFSTDGWNALDEVARSARLAARTAVPGDDTVRAMSDLLRKLAGFSGLVQDNMYRFNGWRFLTLGRANERAWQIADLLATYVDGEALIGSYDVALEVADSVMSHRRRYPVDTNRDTLVDLLVLDRDNPRSIVFQVDRMRTEEERLVQADAGSRTDVVGRLILQLQTELVVAEPTELSSERLLEVRRTVATISDALTERYLS